MKKIILATLFLICFTSVAIGTTAVYRTTSGEVAQISTADNPFVGYDSNFFTVVSDPTFSDGFVADFRTLGLAKIFVAGVVRNATQQEIDGFAAYQLEDNNIRAATGAVGYLQNDPKFRRIMTAFAAIIVDEINILRSEHGLPDRTLSQLKTAIENRISKDD